MNRAKIVIELDGSQHYTEEGMAYDNERSEILQKYNIEVIRFSNLDIDKNFEGVYKLIDEKIKGVTNHDKL